VVLDPHGREAGDASAGSLPDGQDAVSAERALRVAAHRTLRDVTEEHAGFRWNTMVAHLMELTNLLMRYRGTDVAGGPAWEDTVRMLLRMLAPIAPHIAEELWSRRLDAAGEEWRSIHTERWPAFDPALVVADQIELPVQVNGKLRDLVPMAAGLEQAEVERLVLARPKVRANLEGREVARIIHVGGRLMNIVTR
jgi:leucyl-tRNA synthetase